MIAIHPSTTFKKYQDRFIRKNQDYLKRKGPSIKSVRPHDLSSKLTQSNNGDENQSVQRLEALAEKVSQPLLTMTTLPLFELFPTTITIDLKKITINTMTFFKSHSVQTITYENLKEVSLETGLISSALRLVLTGQSMHPLVFPHFKKREALEAKRLILGLIQCQKHQIKPDDLDPRKDIDKIRTLGTAASP